MLHFFRASSWSLDDVRKCWFSAVREHAPLLAEGRDRKAYRDKGKRGTTIKTVYGEVSYSRRVYEKNLEGLEKKYGDLLDETM